MKRLELLRGYWKALPILEMFLHINTVEELSLTSLVSPLNRILPDNLLDFDSIVEVKWHQRFRHDYAKEDGKLKAHGDGSSKTATEFGQLHVTCCHLCVVAAERERFNASF